MNFLDKINQILNRELYGEKEATLLAHNVLDGQDRNKTVCNNFLYRAVKGDFFTVTLKKGQSEQETKKPITRFEAVLLYDGQLFKHEVSFLDAFPDIGF